MTNKEKYDLIRENFKNEALKHFKFSVDEWGYNDPTFYEYKQSNGVVITDTIEYQNPELNKTIQVENSYHPVDYGFEFNLWNSLTDLLPSKKNMLEYYLKEKQDIGQSYIIKTAELIKNNHKDKLT